MEVQRLLNDAGDIDDDVINPAPVPGPANCDGSVNSGTVTHQE